ncbi:MAG: sulfite exporter TauE/SafE family protein [Pyrinomonadaceae bacterium]|nr:sulfite exporter TauE/SafE family protein [Pyrinomonadaceae bacterium]
MILTDIVNPALASFLHPTPYTLHPFSYALSPLELIFLAALFFLTSVVGVVTGSNSLIAVPAMFQFGIDPRVAVATNMFGLTFMAAGGTLPFLGKGTMDRKRLPLLITLTLLGSIVGALLLLVIPIRALPLIISAAMIAVALFTILERDAGVIPGVGEPTRAAEVGAYALTFALGIYGGFFSGGYVTMLTALFVSLFRMTFVEAVSTTKLVNVFSSLVATLVFMARGLVDYKLGLLLGLSMFAGAFLGARITLKLNNIWIRRIFLGTVILLAMKILLYDFLWKGLRQ